MDSERQREGGQERERERQSDPQNATCCMQWGTGHSANLFVLTVAKSQALNSRLAKGVERRSLHTTHTHTHTHTQAC